MLINASHARIMQSGLITLQIIVLACLDSMTTDQNHANLVTIHVCAVKVLDHLIARNALILIQPIALAFRIINVFVQKITLIQEIKFAKNAIFLARNA
jgi:hypothetical protein